jgi:hypothetical protein
MSVRRVVSAAFGYSLTISTGRRTENRAEAVHPLLYQEAERRIHSDRKWIGKLTAEIGEETGREEFIPF